MTSEDPKGPAFLPGDPASEAPVNLLPDQKSKSGEQQGALRLDSDLGALSSGSGAAAPEN